MRFIRKHAFTITSSLLLVGIVVLEAVSAYPHGIGTITALLDVFFGASIGALSAKVEG
jgi:hypothetical protein